MVGHKKPLTFFLIFLFLFPAAGNVASASLIETIDPRNTYEDLAELLRLLIEKINQLIQLVNRMYEFMLNLPTMIVSQIRATLSNLQSMIFRIYNHVVGLPNRLFNKIMLLPQTAIDTVVNLFNWLEITIYNLADSIEAQIPGEFAVVALPAAAALFATTASLIVYGVLYIYDKIPVIG